MNPPTVTMLAGGVLGLMYVALSARVMMARGESGISLGDQAATALAAGQEHTAPPLMVAQRAHLNFAEWVPLSLIVLGLVEIAGAPRWLAALLGAMLVVGRTLHPFGIARRAPNPFRGGGIALNMAMLVIGSLYLLVVEL